MRKINILFVFCMIFLLFSTTEAQVPGNLPPIDVSAAKDYLGIWYLDAMCAGEEGCMTPSDFGITGVLDIRDDNTMILSGLSDEEEEPAYWYMKNGTAYYLNIGQFETEEFEMVIDDQGRFIMGDDETSLIFSREKAVTPSDSEIKANAEINDFLGVWYADLLLTSTMNFPFSMLGINVVLNFSENGTFEITIDTEPLSDIPYEITSGILMAEIPDADGETLVPVNFEYHVDGTLVFAAYPASANEIRVTFSREQREINPSMLGTSGL